LEKMYRNPNFYSVVDPRSVVARFIAQRFACKE